MVQLLLGAVIWAVIVFLPTYIVLCSLCEPGTSIEYLLYEINIPGNAPELWIVMILSWAVGTWIMCDYSHAVYVGAMCRKNRSEAKNQRRLIKEKEREDYESYRNSVRSRQTRYYR